MTTATEERLRQELLGYLDTRTTDYADGPLRVPASTYTDPAYLRREFDCVTRRYPVAVGHYSEVGTEPGSFLRVQAAGLELLVVRQENGSLKALSNTCRHRGTQLESAECGRRNAFSCPYHRWSYDHGGALRSIPFPDGFTDLDRAQLGLLEYPAAVFGGLIWVRPQRGTEALDMAGFVGPELSAEIEASGVCESVLYRKRTFNLAFNWKAVMDGYTDAYHLKFVHAKTVAPYFHTNIYKCDIFGQHRKMVVARRGVEELTDDALSSGEFPKYAISGWQLHPGTIISRPPAHWEVAIISPDASDLTRSTATLMMLVPEMPTTEKATGFRDRNWDILIDTVVNEDWVVAGTIGPSISQSEVEELVLGRNEKATQHFHRMLSADVSGGASA